jgi:cytochrome o ubiquinol oxidase operon protein cyoD
MVAPTNSASSGHQASHGSMKSYLIGFIISIVLTIIPLVVVMNQLLSKSATIVLILAMAVLQFAVQLIFFMHLKEGENARWNVMALLLGLIILLTIVGGSIWIMTYNTVAH